MTWLLRIVRSRVARGILRARQVETIRRSAGSPWNDRGKRSSSITTSTSTGIIWTTSAAAASRNQASKGRLSTSRSFPCSICASQRLTAAMLSARREARRSSPLRSFFESRSELSSHQTQTCVSSKSINGTLQSHAHRLPTLPARRAIPRSHAAVPKACAIVGASPAAERGEPRSSPGA